MTELSALAGSEGYAACDDEAKDMQLATTKRRICSLQRRRVPLHMFCAVRQASLASPAASTALPEVSVLRMPLMLE